MNAPDPLHRIGLFWDEAIVPALADYTRIPAKSPHFDHDWEKNGHIEAAVQFAARWPRSPKARHRSATGAPLARRLLDSPMGCIQNPRAAALSPRPGDTQRQGVAMKFSRILVAALVGAASAVPAQAQTIDKVKKSGEITMGVRESSSPLSYTLGAGQFTGYHVDVCLAIIDNMKKATGGNIKINYTPVTSQNRIPLLQNGTVDIECGSTTNNATRQKDVSFALTTFVTEVRTAVKANSGITSISQLNGKSLATTTGTTSVQTLRKHERANNVDFKEIYGKDHSDSFLLLETGRADAFVMDDNILAGLIATAKNPADYKIVGEVLSVEPIAIMIRKDDPAMKKLADDTIVGMMKSGALEKLYAKWFIAPIPPKNTSVNLPIGATLKTLFTAPNDKPMEDYAKK